MNPKTPGATCAACEIPARLAKAARRFKLTRRELQVLTLSARGDTLKIISEKLQIAGRTVDFHRQHICGKIGKPTVAAAIFELLFFA